MTIFVQGESIAKQVIEGNLPHKSLIVCDSAQTVLDQVTLKLDTFCSNTFVWAACEYSLARKLKQSITPPRELTRITSYWRDGENNHHKELSLD
ncbi:MAG: hypothetical protein ABJK64_12925 [Paraglaciecola sp.]|uniref:hypothetical protein n=1 Tax=Paraglaciecola sp. TaxID=1920173 RepID=UPI0032995CE9